MLRDHLGAKYLRSKTEITCSDRIYRKQRRRSSFIRSMRLCYVHLSTNDIRQSADRRLLNFFYSPSAEYMHAGDI